MSDKQRYFWGRILHHGGIVVALAWGVASLLSFFDVVAHDARWYELIRAFGPLGMGAFAMGGLLCRWDFRGMKERIEAEE